MAQTDDIPAAFESSGASPLLRAVLLVVGTAALIVGFIGIFLPVLPTTPFLLVTAACYARASTRLYAWLLGQPSVGPIVAEWRRSRSLPPGVKTRALIVMAIAFAFSIAVVDNPLLRVGLVGTAIILAVFLYRIPIAQPERRSATIRATPAQKESR